MAQPQHIVGMNDGKAETVIAAGTIHGGAGNKGTHSHVDKSVKNNGQVGIIQSGDHCSGPMTSNMGTAADQKKDPHTLTSAELVEKLRLRECSDATVKIFEEERVTGSEFMDDPELLNELNISNKTDIRKLKC